MAEQSQIILLLSMAFCFAFWIESMKPKMYEMARVGASSTAQKQEGQMYVVGLSCQAQPKTGGEVLGLGFECELFPPQKPIQSSLYFRQHLKSVTLQKSVNCLQLFYAESTELFTTKKVTQGHGALHDDTQR